MREYGVINGERSTGNKMPYFYFNNECKYSEENASSIVIEVIRTVFIIIFTL